MAELEIDRRDQVLLITINRPEARNAVNAQVASGIADALTLLDDDPKLRVGIITGAGGYFSAGMDLKAFEATGERPHVLGRGFAGIVEGPPAKPMIAAIEGFALAGGLEIALACDLLIAAQGAKLGIPETKRGLIAAGGGLLRLPRLVSRTVALELALTGEPLLAERALQLGMVNAVTPPGGALAKAFHLAEEMARNAPMALEASKSIINDAAVWDPADAFDRQRQIVERIMASDDAHEGALAFIEKRPPRWAGR